MENKKYFGNSRQINKQAKAAEAYDTALYVKAYQAGPTYCIRIVKRGISVNLLNDIAKDMSIAESRLAGLLGIQHATLGRKVRECKLLTLEEGSRVFGMARLIGQVYTMICESGEPEGFNAAKWVAHWLDRPLPALGGQRPSDFMDTFEGQALISSIVARMQSGAYT